jgi:hypothetical protein
VFPPQIHFQFYDKNKKKKIKKIKQKNSMTETIKINAADLDQIIPVLFPFLYGFETRI